MNEITIGDKIYISSKRAAEVTGYAKDYVGQLCREGHVDAKMVGRSWYVYEPSIRAHRFGEVAVAPTEPVVEQEEAADIAETDAPEAISTWEQPVYKAEPFEMIPEVPAPAYQEAVPKPEESLTDMQSAWKEWFDRKQQLVQPEIESPEVIDARAEASGRDEEYDSAEEHSEDDAEAHEEAQDEVAIPLHRLAEEPEETYETYIEEDSEPIAIRHIPAPVPEYVPVPPPYIPVHREEAARETAPVAEARVVSERVVRRKRKGSTSYVPATALLVAISIITLTVAAIGSGFTDKYIQAFVGKNPIVNFLVGTSEFKR